MNFKWESCTPYVQSLVSTLQDEITKIINDNLLGFYLHGSLAMGGFNPKSSDIDILVLMEETITVDMKRQLAALLLKYSNSPYPIEISFLSEAQLKNWVHPCPFDFHYSEFWRERYEDDLLEDTYIYLNEDINTDADLAAHITILHEKGICLTGKPVHKVFPSIPRDDYISSIMSDFSDCLENIEVDPIYCILNLIRVFWYLKEGEISSKLEAGQWGLKALPQEYRTTIKKATDSYSSGNLHYQFKQGELAAVRNYISKNVQKLLPL
ncbi:aminoglycoside adenylyltransferase domain-containing protein [Alteribacter natronophilus]|uniref:aminoglycoside adenylyltransferase domain-containing protein n=1 Tax=Alteribacter natronophilus TaxID=2583810 RepID=UPI00110E015D|nr:aminoglycoside adenylyltransferase domain-containing protein [Alteribacter natronophilus]TMW71174.1 DUF4111 domain-containing protein [Alteribacter natronophilus]